MGSSVGKIKRFSKKKNVRECYDFYKCARPVLLCCKLLGFLPLTGIISNKYYSRFQWKSLYRYYYLPNVIWTIISTITKCVDKLIFGLGRKDISGIIFSFNTLFSTLVMMKLAFKWNDNMRKIEDLECLLPNHKTAKPIRNVKRIIFIVLFNTFLEFVTYMIFTVFSAKIKWRNCGPGYCFRRFFTDAYEWFFNHISFQCGFGFMLVISKLQAAFLRNLTDIFIMSVTVYLCARFSYFNNRLHLEERKAQQSGRFMPWSDIQKHYTRLTRIVILLDELVNPFILVSFTSNIIFICKQIFSIIESQKAVFQDTSSNNSDLTTKCFDWEPVLYLGFSTTFVVVRATVVSLFLAHYHTLTRAPLEILHTVPVSAYNYKMQRFMDQVYHSRLSLSGCKFFYVTRESILSMIATLITYELVLLQFPER